jgi:hypothetical protein
LGCTFKLTVAGNPPTTAPPLFVTQGPKPSLSSPQGLCSLCMTSLNVLNVSI